MVGYVVTVVMVCLVELLGDGKFGGLHGRLVEPPGSRGVVRVPRHVSSEQVSPGQGKRVLPPMSDKNLSHRGQDGLSPRAVAQGKYQNHPKSFI